MRNPRFLADMVDLKDDAVRQPLRLDYRLAAFAGEDERHREKRLQGIALSATGRATVSLAARHADAVVEDAGDRVVRDAGTVVD